MKRLLVAVDGSPRAPGVLKAGVVQAQAIGAALVVLRATGIPNEPTLTMMAIPPEKVLNVLEERARAEVTALARNLIPADVPWEIRIETSTAWVAICQVAQAIHADLIVIGSHGYGALDRLLGTTAARVVNHADRSVLVVRPLASHSKDGAAEGEH